ncbi:MAG: hypothetical protein Q4G10_00035 [Bacteroidia bacterium]|nr:hypothetical protein [Bacteroidia bacterium]
MAGNNNDWTDELRDLIEGVELTPSGSGWDRLKADLHPRRAAWWPYAVPAAACLLLGGVFLFKGQPSENKFDVLDSEPSVMVSEASGADVAPLAEGVMEDALSPIVADIPALTAEGMPETVPPSAT